MPYPKANTSKRDKDACPYRIQGSAPDAVCANCGAELGFQEYGLFFCDKDCAELWRRQISEPGKIIPQ